MLPIFTELAAGLLLSTVFGYLARLLRQPLITAYIAAGIAVSFLGLFHVGSSSTFPIFSQIGIALLLFLVGLELKVSDLRQIGKPAVLTGLGQIVSTVLLGFLIVKFLGFAPLPAFFISLALTFSSTVIVVKLLIEKQELNSLYGKITVGFLLVQDFVAIVALMVLSGFSPGQSALPSLSSIALIVLKGAGLFVTAFLLGKGILPSIFKRLATSQELLFISTISWCFIFASLAVAIGFSLEMGAFIAGVILASSPYQATIASKIHPLRDFFVVIFFLLLGFSLRIGDLSNIWLPAAVLSVFVIVGNPLIVLSIMGVLGFRKRTSFLASISIAQISEFSLILMTVGHGIGIVDNRAVSLVTLVGIVTITASSYMIINGNRLYDYLKPVLSVFERSTVVQNQIRATQPMTGHVVLFGCEQMGRDVIDLLGRKVKGESMVVVDFNPKVVEQLTADGFTAVYGDMTDTELLDELKLGEAKAVISTVPYLENNLQLIKFARSKGFTGPLIVTSYWAEDGIRLYETGADYVVIPEFTAGKHIARVLDDHWTNLASLSRLKSRHMAELIGSIT